MGAPLPYRWALTLRYPEREVSHLQPNPGKRESTDLLFLYIVVLFALSLRRQEIACIFSFFSVSLPFSLEQEKAYELVILNEWEEFKYICKNICISAQW